MPGAPGPGAALAVVANSTAAMAAAMPPTMNLGDRMASNVSGRQRRPLPTIRGVLPYEIVTGLSPTIGRDRELARLRTELIEGPPQGPVLRILTGMGGVGKTSLARAYTDRHRADYGL